MDFFRIDGRSGPNILRLDFLFHIYIVNIANCILIKKICSELLLNKMSKIEPFLCVNSCMHCTIPLSAKPFKNILSSVEVPVPLTQYICGRLKSLP